MTIDKVHWFLDLFDELDIKVWIDGGWGVDALLGECTRDHQDLDIIISWEDSAILTKALLARGFVDAYTDDHKDRNFVMGHRVHGKIDFHVIELTEGGGAVYGPGEIDWVITESELSAVGSIGEREVRCLSVGYQVRSHSGYTLQDTDFADLRALHEKYSVKLLPAQTREKSLF
jgi:lincosamide nucleotidyltransferase A/C/D/E